MSTGDSTWRGSAMPYGRLVGSDCARLTNRAPARPGACATRLGFAPPTTEREPRAPRRARDRGAIDESSGELDEREASRRSPPRQKIAVFFGNHKIAEDFSSYRQFVFAIRQIFLHQLLPPYERRFRLVPSYAKLPCCATPMFLPCRARPVQSLLS